MTTNCTIRNNCDKKGTNLKTSAGAKQRMTTIRGTEDLGWKSWYLICLEYLTYCWFINYLTYCWFILICLWYWLRPGVKIWISHICVVCFGYLKYCWMFWPCRNWWVFRYIFKYIDEKKMMRNIMKTGFTWLGSHDAESHFPELMVSVSCLFVIATCLIVITYHIITLQRKWPHVIVREIMI